MSTKYPFSEAGFAALQAMLYTKTDEQLHLEALSINYEFSAWLVRHFELSAEQQGFLSQLSNAASQFMADQTAFAVANRLNISLDKEGGDDDDDDDDGGGKIIWTTSSLSALDGTSGFEASGQLTIHIAYPEL